MPKRHGNLFDQICSERNLQMALDAASKGKTKHQSVRAVLADRDRYISELGAMLRSESFTNSSYRVFDMLTREGKLRKIYALPFFPDRILHHAIVQVCGPIWIKSFVRHTYACIPGRGIHDAVNHIRAVMPSLSGYYALKCDLKKYFPSINHSVLKGIIRRKIKDRRVLSLLDEIIDSAPGLPVGNYLSQYLGNLALSPFDHWIKSTKRIKYYYRYCDDFVVLHESKAYLHALRLEIQQKLAGSFSLVLKGNWQVYSLDTDGLDFVGYRFWPTLTLLRKQTVRRYLKRTRLRSVCVRNALEVLHQLGCFRGWRRYCSPAATNCLKLAKTHGRILKYFEDLRSNILSTYTHA